MKPYLIQLPSKVAGILPSWEAVPPFKGFNIDKAEVLLSIVATHQRKNDSGDIYAQLKMEYLRNIVYNAVQYFKTFIENGIIFRLGGYTPGEQSYRYQFTQEFQSLYVAKELQDNFLLKRLTQAKTKKGRADSRFYPKQKQQLKTMTINYDAAFDLIKKQYPDKKDIQKYNFAIGQATRIINKDFYLVRDDSGNRVHTPLSNLTGFLRSQVKINGQYLSGLDISNSQLYFATKLLTDPESVKDFFPGSFPLMMLKCLRLSQQQDVIAFVLLVIEAKLYKFLEDKFIKAGLKIDVVDPDKVSDETKRKIFTILFEENHLTSKAKKIFQQFFPNVDKAFSCIRMANYTNFVNGLARLESFAINDLVIERMNRERPDMVAQQIYDNVVTSIVTDDIVTARRIMTEELTKFIGYPPVLKVENFRSNPIFNTFSPLKEGVGREEVGRYTV